LKVGRTTPRTFDGRIRELVEGHPTLTTIAEALLAARSVLHRGFQGFERQVRTLARRDDRARLLMSDQRRKAFDGVGVLVSLTYASALDEPERFKRSKQVGAHFGLTPRRCQSGEKDVSGRISKIGDRSVRSALYEAANVILTKAVKGGALKSWGMRLAARAGRKKAKVALARKLAAASHAPTGDAACTEC
jgi:transposase